MTREEAEECYRDRAKVITPDGLGEIIRLNDRDWADILISAPSYYHAEVKIYHITSLDIISQPLVFAPQESIDRSAIGICSEKDLISRYEYLEEALGWRALSQEEITEMKDIGIELRLRGGSGWGDRDD